MFYTALQGMAHDVGEGPCVLLDREDIVSMERPHNHDEEEEQEREGLGPVAAKRLRVGPRLGFPKP